MNRIRCVATPGTRCGYVRSPFRLTVACHVFHSSLVAGARPAEWHPGLEWPRPSGILAVGEHQNHSPPVSLGSEIPTATITSYWTALVDCTASFTARATRSSGQSVRWLRESVGQVLLQRWRLTSA